MLIVLQSFDHKDRFLFVAKLLGQQPNLSDFPGRPFIFLIRQNANIIPLKNFLRHYILNPPPTNQIFSGKFHVNLNSILIVPLLMLESEMSVMGFKATISRISDFWLASLLLKVL
jgi:hypothetical protein